MAESCSQLSSSFASHASSSEEAVVRIQLLVVVGPTVFQNEPFFEFARTRFPGWSVATGVVTFFCSGYVVLNVLPRLLCHVPGAVTVNADEAHWIYNPGGNVTVDLDGHEVALCFSSSSVARLAA